MKISDCYGRAIKSTIEYLTGVINERLDGMEKALKESVDELNEKSKQLEKINQ